MAYAALHRTVFYGGEDTGLFVVAGDDGSRFFARRQPPFFDAKARPTSAREILPGSVINVQFGPTPRYRQINAVQIVSEAEPVCPFQPVSELVDG